MGEEIQEKDGTSDAASGKGKRARRVKLVPVRVVHREGKAALVEWMDKGEPFRVIVPAEMAETKKVPKDVLEAGYAYGEDWAQVEGVTPLLALELKRVGIWTKDDMRARSHLARAAVTRAFVPQMMKALLKYAREEN